MIDFIVAVVDFLTISFSTFFGLAVFLILLEDQVDSKQWKILGSMKIYRK